MTDIVERLRDENYWGQIYMRHEAADEIERLRERLEMYPVNISTGELDKDVLLTGSCDGIACRDETIKQQDRRIAKLEKVLEAHVKYGLFCDICIEAGRTECIGHTSGG